MAKILPVILAGGSGTRLWPLSREAYPKQFLALNGPDTLLQQTWQRVSGLVDGPPIVVANDEHRFIVAEQMRQIGVEPLAVLLEPVGKNTAPAIAVAALHVLSLETDPLLLILPSDHMIQDVAGFAAAVRGATEAAEQGRLITFGVVPNRPETGYGYIRPVSGTGVRDIEKFVEKPVLQAAQEYVADGGYLWNSGMFLFRASQYLAELEKFHPEILAACEHCLSQSKVDLDFVRLDREALSASPSLSIDYAVMEKTENAAVIDMDASWNDIGSWDALWEALPQDAMGNVGMGDIISRNCKNTLALSESRLVATVGLEDVIVIDTQDALLVAHRSQSQQIKAIVADLKDGHHAEATQHRKVYRPWGTYDLIDQGCRFKVKKITVNPGHSLSMQMHHHRAEHWIVVSGTAKVIRDGQTILLQENQSTYISPMVRHRLENPGQVPLELVEVQSGSYLEENDIVRFDDRYGRTG